MLTWTAVTSVDLTVWIARLPPPRPSLAGASPAFQGWSGAQDLVLGSVRVAQSRSGQVQKTLEMGSEGKTATGPGACPSHLGLPALVAGDFIGLRFTAGSGEVARVFMRFAGDAAGVDLWAASVFRRAGLADLFQSAVSTGAS